MKGWNKGIRFFTTLLVSVFSFKVKVEVLIVVVVTCSAILLLALSEFTLAVVAPAADVRTKVQSGPMVRPGTVSPTVFASKQTLYSSI